MKYKKILVDLLSLSLSFVHTDSPLFLNNPNSVRPGPTDHEVDLMHSVSRIMLNGFIDNIQVSWTKLGAERVVICFPWVNDLGGTLMNESISVQLVLNMVKRLQRLNSVRLSGQLGVHLSGVILFIKPLIFLKITTRLMLFL